MAGKVAGLDKGEYSFPVEIVMSSGPLTDEENKLIELIDGVIKGVDSVGCVAFIRALRMKKIDEKKEELKEEAKKYRHKDMYKKALEEWRKVLEIDAADTEALRETEELTRIIEKEQKIKGHASSAKKYCEGGNNLDAIAEWIEVLRLDPESVIAINGIEKNLETIKGKSAPTE